MSKTNDEMMEIVIKIPKKHYDEKLAIWNSMFGSTMLDDTDLAILTGQVLPKGHGNLKDEDTIIKALQEKAGRPSIKKNLDTVNGLCGAVNVVLDAPIIVEADKEGKDEINM